jgi:hypothetical protein
MQLLPRMSPSIDGSEEGRMTIIDGAKNHSSCVDELVKLA